MGKRVDMQLFIQEDGDLKTNLLILKKAGKIYF